jgi:hypothetical protein
MNQAVAPPKKATPQQRAAGMQQFEELQKQHDAPEKR